MGIFSVCKFLFVLAIAICGLFLEIFCHSSGGRPGGRVDPFGKVSNPKPLVTVPEIVDVGANPTCVGICVGVSKTGVGTNGMSCSDAASGCRCTTWSVEGDVTGSVAVGRAVLEM